MAEGDKGRRSPLPLQGPRGAVSARPPVDPRKPRDPRPVPAGASRPVVGVGPGSRPPAPLSVIASIPPRHGSPRPGSRRPGSPLAPRLAPSPAPRPETPGSPRFMQPPIARTAPPARLAPAALQAAAVFARPGPGARLVDLPGDLAAAGGRPAGGSTRLGFGMPNLRRNVCPHFFMTGVRGAIPIQAPHLLKALVRQETNVSRCQLRGGVHLEQGFINDVCLSARFNQCVFYEDELGR